ncbi:MAG: APC family permease [Gemmatimonadota bacterium]
MQDVGAVRTLGRWSLAALVLNTIIGTGVFVLPGTAAGRLGWASLAAWAIAALLTAAMVFCFAEVASRFEGAGGAYLYSQAAFGRFAGIQIGWINYFARVTAAAAQANAFATYLAELWPAADSRAGGVLVNTVFIGFLAAANVRSVATGARLSNVLAVVKLLPLVAFGALGVVFVVSGAQPPDLVGSDSSLGSWLQLLLLLMFAYGGFESALIPLAEAKDPRRDAPFALVTGLVLVTVVYLAAQLAVLATLQEPAATNRPLAESARAMLGNTGAVIISVAALLSIYGWLASMILTVPRITSAMAERGDLPRLFAQLHPRFRTPWLSILIFSGVAWMLSVSGGLIQNLSLSAVSRLVVYGTVCAALPVFRNRDTTPGKQPVGRALFRAPAGSLLAVVGVLTSIVLASRMNTREAVSLVIMVTIAVSHWLAVRGREPDRESPTGRTARP